MLKSVIKFSLLCLAGVAVFEFVRGMVCANAISDRGERSDLDRALNEDLGRMMNMTGPGRGMTTLTEDADGAASPHLVGRGVVSP